MVWQHYSKLLVWQKAMELTDEVYALTRILPKEERYGLSNQMRRAVVSIPSNIAEGQGRQSAKDVKQFLCVARGSTFETETQLLICTRLGFFTYDQADRALSLCSEIARILSSLILKYSNLS